MAIVPHSPGLDQQAYRFLLDHDPLVRDYRQLFALLDWTVIPKPKLDPSRPGKRPHPETAYIKALLVKLREGLVYCSQLRRFLLMHPLLVLDLGFRPVLDCTQPYGFDVARTVPSARWFRQKQRTLEHRLLQDLLHATVHALQEEIPGLGETIAVDVKHIYAWVQANNPRVSLPWRFLPANQPSGDPDCRVGVKRSYNQERADGSKKERKEYLWGYGSGIVSATLPDYGDVVLAEFTQPFNASDVSYYLPLFVQTVAVLGFFPTHLTADAAFDAWYVYQTVARRQGIAAIPLHIANSPAYTAQGIPLCPKQLPMHPTYQFRHTHGYRAQRYRCPLLFPTPTGQRCPHEQFSKGKGCVKDVDIEPGGRLRVLLDRSGPLYHAVYRQRTSAERLNSQTQALGLERPKVRNGRSVKNLNTLTYILINAKALARARSINRRLLVPNWEPESLLRLG